MNRGNSPDVQSYLGEQAADIIDEDTSWVSLAEELDVERYKYRDGHPDNHAGTPFRPMFLSCLWALVEDESLSGIPERLTDNSTLARAFGFDPDNLPSESTCKPCRLESRFEELESTLERAVEEIQELAAERGAPIGCRIGNTDLRVDEDPSKRTVDRLLRKEGRQVLDELKEVAIPALSLPQPDDAIYDEEELLVMEAIAAINQSAANNAGEELCDEKNPRPNLDDPFYEDGPSGETLLEAMKDMSIETIGKLMNFALQKTYTRAKPRLRELESENGARFGVQAKVAIDITYVAYRGERDEMEWLQGAPSGKEYNWCHKFATAVIVGENTHYTVGVCPLGSTDHADTDAYPGRDKSYYPGDVARRLLSIADQYVNIDMVYADREFHAADVLYTLQQKQLDYIIPAVKDRNRLGPMCERFDQLKSGYDEENDTPLHVVDEYAVHGPVKHDVSNTRVETTLVILPPDEDDDANEDESPQPFVTSLDVSDEVALDRRWAKKQIEGYNKRAAIENSYSSIKEAAAWTTSKEFEVRWFHFAFGCLVYNLWLLVDFLTQDRIGVIETRKKPRITLSRFLNWLDKELDTLL